MTFTTKPTGAPPLHRPITPTAAHVDEAIDAIELASQLSDDDIVELRALTTFA
jgi:hypothetical protein